MLKLMRMMKRVQAKAKRKLVVVEEVPDWLQNQCNIWKVLPKTPKAVAEVTAKAPKVRQNRDTATKKVKAVEKITERAVRTLKVHPNQNAMSAI